MPRWPAGVKDPMRRAGVSLARHGSPAGSRALACPALTAYDPPMAPHARLLIACLALASCGDAGRDPDAPQRTTPAATDGTSADAVAPTPPDRAADQGETLTVRLYFTRNEEPEPVEREIPRGAGVLRATLEAQLRGPTTAEQEAGFFSWFSDETAGMLGDVRLDDTGRAIIDFRDFSRTISGASTSAGSRILLNELNRTVFQFDTVRSVEYRIEGSCEAFWNWLQAECTVVERP
jgi:hypothetical protein